ncbi:hypothetical protein DIPPA_28571 [Diplonema papillatum]|nr:hypothetical protein DIPPA_19116 [Diplonema papillatum]KAJ9459806.1 hypothetical protein DIPPA_28571 [Diplonema papillatum]
MPKQGKREVLKQAKLEAWEEGKRRDRLNMEEEELQMRKEIETGEDYDRQNTMLQKLEEYVSPEQSLSVSMAYHTDVEKRWKVVERKKDEELFETKMQLVEATQARQFLERQLRDVRTDQRQIREAQLKKMESLKAELLAKLEQVTGDIAGKLLNSDEPLTECDANGAKQSTTDFCDSLRKTQHAYLDLMRDVQKRCDQMTGILQESKSTHSNLPTRIRRQLQDMPTDTLLLIIDTLSFDPEVLQFFMFKFPPAADLPYGEHGEGTRGHITSR